MHQPAIRPFSGTLIVGSARYDRSGDASSSEFSTGDRCRTSDCLWTTGRLGDPRCSSPDRPRRGSQALNPLPTVPALDSTPPWRILCFDLCPENELRLFQVIALLHGPSIRGHSLGNRATRHCARCIAAPPLVPRGTPAAACSPIRSNERVDRSIVAAGAGQ